MKKIELDLDDRLVFIIDDKIHRKTLSEIVKEFVKEADLDNTIIYLKENRW